MLKNVVMSVGLGFGMMMAVGCGDSVCDKAADVAKDCGEDEPSDAEMEACEKEIERCSDSDQDKLSEFYDCIGDNECSDESFMDCASKLEGISEECGGGFGG